MTSAKAEAVKAVEHVRGVLLSGEPITPLQRRILTATLEHALEQIQQIQELKRARRAKPEASEEAAP